MSMKTQDSAAEGAPLPDPHDGFFRETFSRREVAEGFLRSYLPESLAGRIDWASLEIAKDSFIEKALRKHFSDLSYSARYGGGDVKIYLLLEHKSHPDAWVALQLLRYQVRIWELHRRQRPGQPLPPIVPLVLYHGARRWRTPESFRALFGGLDETLAPYVPDFRHELCNLNLPEPAQIQNRVLSRLVLLSLRHIFDPEPKRALADILPLVREILDRDTALEMLEVVLRYYVQTTQTLDENDIRDLLGATADGENTMPTFIDRYIEQGRQQGLFMGIEKGREEGRQEGRKEGRKEGQQEGLRKGRMEGQAEVLLRLMARKFGVVTPEQRRRIAQADGETLLRWSEQVLFATTVDEALR
jgi:predicted transposase/invertase (TIGR01784 family)